MSRLKGLEIRIEQGAGDAAGYPDSAYAGQGASTAPTSDSLYETADIILKVQPPSGREAESFREGSTLVSFLCPLSNPAARTKPDSPLYGMPVLDVDKAKTVVFIKRSTGPGFAGVENDLFYLPNTMMVFGDAKRVLTELVVAVRKLGA